MPTVGRPLSSSDRSLFARVAVAGGWTLAAGMTGIGLNRVVRSKRFPRLIGLQAVGMWLLIPAYPLALAALISRRWMLAGVAVALSAANAVWIRRLSAFGKPGAAAADSVRLRLVTANIFDGNVEFGLLAADLIATGADLLLLQEVTEDHLSELRAAGVAGQVSVPGARTE